MTYSIVARDPATGELGVAVQSRYLGVGSVMPWAEPGVGAVATQAFTEVRYGPLGLALMRGGHSAPDALRALIAGDDVESLRQVGMVDATVDRGAHGIEVRCRRGPRRQRRRLRPGQHDGERHGMGRDLAAYASADGSLPDRLLAALEAAEAEGGDIRGRQSAALIVVSGSRQDPPWKLAVDVRVDDHPDPVAEIERLLRLHTAFRLMEEANDAAATGDLLSAAAAMDQAGPLAPDDDQVNSVAAAL